MTKKRFCIRCGAQIGDLPYCKRPECATPNFYRNLTRPRHVRQPGTTRTTAATSAVDAGETSSARGEKPVAVLRGMLPPHPEHQIRPGRTAIGAAAPADIILASAEVSTRHAHVDCVAGGDGGYELTLHDRDSLNGTFVNGERVAKRRLREGDRVRFANVEYVLTLSEPQAGTPRVTLPLDRT